MRGITELLSIAQSVPFTVRLLVLALALSLGWTGPALAQSAAPEIEFLEHDAAAKVDRYRITIQPGTSLWSVAIERLPLKALDEADRAAFALLEESFHRSFPNRDITSVYPGEDFVLEVAEGTFVSEKIDRTRDEEVYIAFNGDRLIHYLRDPNVLYRLVRAGEPDQAEVRLRAGDGDPVELAKQVYQVDPPDFLQVRWMREALSDEQVRVTVDVNRRYLDEFRNHWARASKGEEGKDGLTTYTFSEAQIDIPFLRVDDAVGEKTNPVEFPRVFRVEYYKDGSIKKYVITQPGDLLAVLQKPQDEQWGTVYEDYDTWKEGEPGDLEPFASARTDMGSLVPGRILVLTFQPKPKRATSGIECFGLPLLIMAGGLVLHRRERLKYR